MSTTFPAKTINQNTQLAKLNKNSLSQNSTTTVSHAIVNMLEQMGVQYAFGVSGGAIAPLWDALAHSSIQVLHFRHEAGAAFAAAEAYFASNKPVVVFTTTGPGITNALTGLMAARWEGAKVIFLSGATSAPQRGRWACQETSTYTMPHEGIFTSGTLFNYATTFESPDQLPVIARRLASGLEQPGGFVAHVSISRAIQASKINSLLPLVPFSRSLVTTTQQTVAECGRLLSEGHFAIWVGFGARSAAEAIRQLAETTGAGVICSPRGKGIFPEDHSQFVGVTGFAGHESVLKYMQEQCPLRTLVLGTRLGELTSLWNPNMIPKKGFVHVDLNSDIPGTAYPNSETVGIQSDINLFVKELLNYFSKNKNVFTRLKIPRPQRFVINPNAQTPVRPQVLMNMIQRIIVEGSNAIIMAEGGNSLAWATHLLRFTQANRYRITTRFASMGHFVTGVVGAAIAHQGKAIAIVGDGAMLMNNEISTAVKYAIPVVWIVLNDGRYNMCEQGMGFENYNNVNVTIPKTDFVKIALGMGAKGIRVENESQIKLALEQAMASSVPFVVDVVIDSSVVAPIGKRIQSLMAQKSNHYLL
ncbi:thiamine pyrophosphate-binding protein [Gloeothece verrucosa]|uniref:Thiamine pyrophosphate protein domain protein TPP-binding protein n=1 Tax=Gloeothece verrucosa (strain PCC 7822) TaxID=497965 RepID=E0ULM7_GLOV7|nr:thiamine pyrophosphate-binding protein [Gloeothece verrucosa]ADN17857.1 thiamine pyrophosphate protein domain protein TPP-binding protein [Gloeothece verrucosa PCC 7822]